MSNHRFIQVDPPKEELTLPATIADLEINQDFKSLNLLGYTFKSPVATFTGVVVGDFLQLSFKDPDTDIETFLGTVEVSVVTSVNEIEIAAFDQTVLKNIEIMKGISLYRSLEIPKLYKLPTNNFSLQIKTDSIVRYYEDPVDKTIMYIDTLESSSICGHGTGACQHVWGHDRASLGIVTLNNTDKIPMHNIVPYLNSIFLEADDEN